jgi:hypothetical protein
MAPRAGQTYTVSRVRPDGRLSPVLLSVHDTVRRVEGADWRGQRPPKPMFAAAAGRLYYVPANSSRLAVLAVADGSAIDTIDISGVLATREAQPTAPPAVVAAVLPAADGALAVVRHARGAQRGDSVRVGLFDTQGRARGIGALPPGTIVHAFSGTHLFTAQPGPGGHPVNTGSTVLVRYRVISP